MKLPQKHRIAASISVGLVSATILAARLVWSQTAPVLGISLMTNNAVLVTVTNGASTEQYQLYWTECLAPDPEWLLLTNGSIGQTQFLVPMDDWEMTYLSASAISNFVPPSLSVIILSPTNGMLLQ